LLERLVGNHPLPDGNKRAAFVTTVLFLERNGLEWGEPDVAVDAGMVGRVAAGEAELPEIARWVTARVTS
jgi:death-on-curing protein